MAADISIISPEQSYAVLIDESTWATMPGSPVRVHVPVTSSSVKFAPKRRNLAPRTGLFQRKHGRTISGQPNGQIAVPLYGWIPTGLTYSLAQWLLEWGFLDQEQKFRRSKILEWAEGPNIANDRHLGLRVNSATLAGSEDNGIALTLDVIGQDTANFATANALPTNRNLLVEFLFEDATLTLDGSAAPMSAFQWQVQAGLQSHYWNASRPQSMPKSQWTETFSVTPPKQGHSWVDKVRTGGMQEVAATLNLKGLHNGTGTGGTNWTTVAVALPRLSLINADEAEQNGVINEPLTFDVLKPDTSDNGSAMTFGESA